MCKIDGRNLTRGANNLMIFFNNDYSEGAHPQILERLTQTNMDQTPGYGMDPYCEQARKTICKLCGNPDLKVHFLVGGTQANLTVIAAALRPHQGVIGVETAHINVHETGSIEATGHKVLTVPGKDGKLTAQQVETLVKAHIEDEAAEHTVQPKMVYFSNPTELGTLYHKDEMEAISAVCRKYGLYLFVDGARLGYGLAASENDVTLEDYARLCDAFYIGGTKIGLMFGEAVVFSNPALDDGFRYCIKQHGGMLAKGRLLGVQFEALLADGLMDRMASHADRLADRIREALAKAGYPLMVPGTTNQIFTVLPDADLAELTKTYVVTYQQRMDETHSAIRICTSWATKEENVDALCRDILAISGKN